jgi:hypothetical protein
MKIYYKYGSRNKLVPDGGDTINEINNLKALSRFSEVYYNHRRCWDSGTFGPVHRQNYDAYIIRNNKKEFLSIGGHSKYWIASPPDNECFSTATKILTFSQTWTDMLKNGVKFGLNPTGQKWENVFAVHQCIGDHFKPMQDSIFTIDLKKDKFNDSLVIGHFGRIVQSNWPHLLCSAWSKILKEFGSVKILAGTTKTPFPLKDNRVVQYNIPYQNVPYFISACDVIILGQHGEEWDYCGNLKTKEAAACGIPVICERSCAREEEFGKNYELFMPRHSMEPPSKLENVKILIEKIKMAVEAKKAFGNYLVDHMKFYSIKNMSDRYKDLLE